MNKIQPSKLKINSKFRIPILIFVLFFAAFWRLYQLTQVPPSPSLDEASLGWNAYSILETGRDEYGYPLPILLRAYDDWRPAGYVYLIIPFVKILGLNVLAVRLPAAIIGTLTVLLTYYLVNELFINELGKNNELFNSLTRNKLIALTASFFLAISPWHIYISRLGHEVNLSHFFAVLGIYLFLKYQNLKENFFLFGSAFCFALSFYSYQSSKIFVPLLVLFLVFIYKNQAIKDFRNFIVAGLLGMVILIPTLKAFFTPEGMARFQGTSLLAHSSEVFRQAATRVADDYQRGDYLGLIFDNRRVAAVLTILRAYFSHFDLSWLFFNSGREPHKIPNFGLFPLWFAPLFLAGIYHLIAGPYPWQKKLVLAAWFLLAPMGASLTTDAPHAMRSFNILPAPQIIAGMGTVFLWEKISKNWRKKVQLIFGLFLVFHLFNLFHQYFINFPREQSDSFQYSLKMAIGYAVANENNFQKIIITNQNAGYQSYMFYLFYSKYSPKTYLNDGGTISGGYLETHRIGKYEFRPIEWAKDKNEKNVLLIGNIGDFPSGLNDVKEFNLLNNQKSLVAVEVK